MTTSEITAKVEETFLGGQCSNYYYGDQKLVRISNHLQKAHNVLDNQNDGDAMVFIFGAEILEYNSVADINDHMAALEIKIEHKVEVRAWFICDGSYDYDDVQYYMDWLKK